MVAWGYRQSANQNGRPAGSRTAFSSSTFLLDPHFGGDGLVMVIRYRDPDKTWTIRHPSSWRPNWRGRQGRAVDDPTGAISSVLSC